METYYNDVNDWLSVGGDLDLARDVTGQPFDVTIAQLREHGVTHVLDVRSEFSDARTWEQMGLPAANYCNAPIIDSHRHQPAESWYQAVEDFVGRFWMDSAAGDRLYVHCHMGINRAPSAGMLALMMIEGMHPWEAFLTIREARPIAGLVYADAVGARWLADDPEGMIDFLRLLDDYWTPNLVDSINRGMAYYRTQEGGTLKVDAQDRGTINPALNLGLTN